MAWTVLHQIRPLRGLRKASSPQAQGADSRGYRYFVQLALEGVPYHKPKLAAHRKSLHGRKVHEIIAVGNTIILAKMRV